MTYLNNVKQNAIKFTSNESDYSNFLSNNGILIANSNGSTFLD